jgi:hypothetical protein
VRAENSKPKEKGIVPNSISVCEQNKKDEWASDAEAP